MAMSSGESFTLSIGLIDGGSVTILCDRTLLTIISLRIAVSLAEMCSSCLGEGVT